MLLAAGLGTRLKPLTNGRPKALVQIHGKTLLELNIQRLKSAGFTELIINVHHYAQQIIDFVQKNNAFGLHIEFSVEDRLLDTGGGLKKARWFFDDVNWFLVHNVDVLTDLDYKLLFNILQKEPNTLACLAVRPRQTTRYLLFDEKLYLRGWQNQKNGQQRIPLSHRQNGVLRPLAFLGVQALHTKSFDLFPSQEKFSLIDAYLHMVEQNANIKGLVDQNARWIDVGKPESLEQAKTLFKDWF